MIVLTKLTRRASLLLLEDAFEVAQIVESAVETDFADALGCIHEHSGGIAQAKVDDVFRKFLPVCNLKKRLNALELMPAMEAS